MLRKNNDSIIVLINVVLLLIIVVASFSIPFFLFPNDILNYLPSFTIDSWVRPHNSLLADPIFQFEPWRFFAKQSLLHGVFPLWTDLNGNGAPFFANMQSAVLYPLNILYYVLPTIVALWLIPLLKLYAIYIFSYIYFRSLKIVRSISMVGGLSISLSGFMIGWLLWPHTNVFIFLPLLLFLTEKLRIPNKYNFRWYVLLSLTYCFAVFGGHPETLLYVTLMHFSYVIFRYYDQKKKILSIIASSIIGIALAAVQLIPFIEYLFNSYALYSRSVHHISTLPLISIVLNLFPFLLGAPHREYYKPLDGTNFQEAISGYIGPAILLFSMLGDLLLFKKNKDIRFWTVVIVLCVSLSYGLIPQFLYKSIPIFGTAVLSRLLAISAFGMVVIATMFLNELPNLHISVSKRKTQIALGIVIAIFISLISVWLLAPTFIHGEKLLAFFYFLSLHILWILTSTAIFFTTIVWLHKNHALHSLKVLYLIIPLFMQTLGLFYDYVPITSRTSYYPENTFIQALQKLPRGTVLEVGNMLLPEDINVKYNIPQIKNYDALEIKDYRQFFDTTFSNTNHWNRVDKTSLQALQTFGIKYVVSDYDINLKQQDVNSDISTLLPALNDKNEYKVSFIPTEQNLKQVRILSANFNRLNTCKLHLELSLTNTNNQIFKDDIPCQDLRDKMFYTFTLPDNISLEKGSYTLLIKVQNSSPKNTVALWGDNQMRPYVKLLYLDDHNTYENIYHNKSVYIWKMPNSTDIVGTGLYTISNDIPESKEIQINQPKAQNIEIKIPFYPGWKATIDGSPITIQKSHAFMSLSVPQGKHILKLRYSPRSFQVGLLISIVSVLCLLIFTIIMEVKRKFEN